MTVSPRAQYLCGRSVVDLAERRVERGVLTGADTNLVDLADTDSHGDLQQAEYYQGMLDDRRTEVEAELAHHCASLAVHQTNPDAPRVRRSQRIIRVKEAELAEINRLTDALRSRFPISRLDGRHGNSGRAFGAPWQ
ncbi:hypothetical protein [Mycolicibacterium moriokaense]|uniref:Uncharacterized protein n=1 Tax=Mycolicibacterium moriokaense TaxID=39691 RepID=A0A318HH23_9MYCO|nr:hypothetical protein [Mycolicibacterium moriokaense]PXX03292.1 hypothetical protein C8E89_12394 [Mycolicibacterium moriokaense]